MRSDNQANPEDDLPVCELKHRVNISGGGAKGPYKYKCCDARDCYWKKNIDGDIFCLFDRDLK